MNLVHMPDIYLDFNKMGIPHVCTVHTTIKGQVSGFLNSNKNFFKMAPSEKMSLLLYPYIHFQEKRYVKKYAHFITVSEKFVGILKKEYDLTGKTIVAIHNGIDTDRINPSKYTRKDALVKFPQLKGKKNIVTFAGRIITQKGIQDFIEACSSLDCHAVIAGRGDEKLLFKLIKQHNLKNYTYLGYVPNKDLPYVLALTDVFVLPSYYENFPISLLEAMAMKVACIGTDVGAVDEIIENGKTGLLIPPGKVAILKKEIRNLISHQKLKIRIAQNSQNNIKKKLSLPNLTNKCLKTYQAILRE
jgi:glycosyltransferase involved in cell wall biosynthesis